MREESGVEECDGVVQEPLGGMPLGFVQVVYNLVKEMTRSQNKRKDPPNKRKRKRPESQTKETTKGITKEITKERLKECRGNERRRGRPQEFSGSRPRGRTDRQSTASRGIRGGRIFVPAGACCVCGWGR